MKIPQLKSNLLFISALIPVSLLLTQPLHAQSDLSGPQIAYSSARETAFSRPSNARLNDIPTVAYRHFAKIYLQHAEGTTWTRVSNGYQARFQDNGILCQVSYDEKGTFRQAIRYLEPAQADADLVRRIRKAFPGYEPDIISEINNECRIVYLITMKNQYTMKSVLLREGEFQLIDDLDYAGR
jgi:hypothetical protein